MRYFYYLLVVWILALIGTACSTASSTPPKGETPAFMGAWEVQEIHYITPDTTYSLAPAQPGLLLITPTRYAIQWIPTPGVRTPFANLSEPTDDELKAGFRSVVFNAGTYAYDDSVITTTARIAKVPGFEGGMQYYRYKVEGEKMIFTMFDETYPDGAKPSWFGNLETKMVLTRAAAEVAQ